MKIAFTTLLVIAVLFFAFASAAENPFQATFDKLLAEDDKILKHKSGMLIKVLKKGGDGAKSPNSNDKCQTHYAGFLLEKDGSLGKKFDSSYDRGQPLALAPSGVITGWKVAMQEMGEGDKLRLWIPPAMAYGSQGAGGVIPGGAALVFDMELLKVTNGGKDAAAAHDKWKENVGKSWDEIEASE